ncbi:MAG: hypothetical protein WA865_11360, partial [Spirulinaceae cyanobacterium]
GQMLPSKELNKQVAAATTIDKLGLNIDLLQSMRSQAIESILDVIDDLTEEEKQKLIEGYEKSDDNEQYEEFCTVLVYILKSTL